MTLRPHLRWILSLTCVAALGLWLYGRRGEQDKQQLLFFVASLDQHSTRSSIVEIINSGEHPRLALRQMTPSRWMVATPTAWHARNWVAWLEFSGDSLAAVRVRILDSDATRPPGAPPDVEF